LRRRALLLAVCMLIAGCAALPAAHDDDRLARVEALALLQTFNADLLGHASATLTLERWCGDHHLADPVRIVAQRVRDAARPLPDELRAKLGVGAGEAVGYRHVRLTCGTHVLSEADNWYLPARLTPDMNRRLETTDEPFGKVIAPLHFQRRTLSAALLWSPLPPQWEMADAQPAHVEAAPLRIPHFVLRHEAILYSAAQVPISVVIETYTNQVFAFADWQRRLDE
jgi:chorismate-pyruvate lyase